MDRWKSRIGAGLALGRTRPAHAPSVTPASITPALAAVPAASASVATSTAAATSTAVAMPARRPALAGPAPGVSAGPAVAARAKLASTASAKVIAATRARSRWASARNQAPSPAAQTVYTHPAYGARPSVTATMM